MVTDGGPNDVIRGLTELQKEGKGKGWEISVLSLSQDFLHVVQFSGGNE